MDKPSVIEEQHDTVETTLSKEMLVKIGGYILEGLSEDEACTLAGFSPQEFHLIKAKNEGVRLYLQKQWIQFKHSHLKEITGKKSDKNSMWLLEKLRPDEFGSQKKGPDTQVNIIGAIIRDIQNDPNNTAIVTLPKQVTGGTANKSSQDIINIDSILR